MANLNYVRFYKGSSTNFPTTNPSLDNNAIYAISNINSENSKLPTFDNTGQDLSSRLSELFIGGNLVGVGHLATPNRPGLVPALDGTTTTGKWYLKGTPTGVSWASFDASDGPLWDVMLRHTDQDIFSRKTTVGHDFNVLSANDDDIADAGNSGIFPSLNLSTYLGQYTYYSFIENGDGPKIYGITDSDNHVDSPLLKFPGFSYKEPIIDKSVGVANEQYDNSYNSYDTSASYVIGKRLIPEINASVTVGTNPKISRIIRGGLHDYMYIGSSFIGLDSVGIESNEIIKIASPNGFDLKSLYNDNGDGVANLENVISIPARMQAFSNGQNTVYTSISPKIYIGRENPSLPGNISIDTQAYYDSNGNTHWGEAVVLADKFFTRNGQDDEYVRGDGELGGVFGINSIGLVPSPNNISSPSTKFLNASGSWTSAAGDHKVDQIALGTTDTNRYPILLKYDSTSSSLSGSDANVVNFSGAADALDSTKIALSASQDGSLYSKSLNAIGGDISLINPDITNSPSECNLILGVNVDSSRPIGNTPSIIFKKGNSKIKISQPYHSGNNANWLSISRVVNGDDIQVATIVPEFGSLYLYTQTNSSVDGGLHLYASTNHLANVETTRGNITSDGGNIVTKCVINNGTTDTTTGFVKSPKFKVTQDNGTDITGNSAFTTNTFIRADGSGWGGVYGLSEDQQTHQKLPGLVPISNVADTGYSYVLKADGSWISPSDLLNSAGGITAVNANPIASTSANSDYFPLLATGGTNPGAGVDLTVSGIVYQGAQSGGSYTYNVAINKQGYLKATRLSATDGVLELGTGTGTTGSISFGSNQMSISHNTMVNGNVTLKSSSDHYKWTDENDHTINVCEWESLD